MHSIYLALVCLVPGDDLEAAAPHVYVREDNGCLWRRELVRIDKLEESVLEQMPTTEELFEAVHYGEGLEFKDDHERWLFETRDKCRRDKHTLTHWKATGLIVVGRSAEEGTIERKVTFSKLQSMLETAGMCSCGCYDPFSNCGCGGSGSCGRRATNDLPVASEPAPLRIIHELPPEKEVSHAYRWVRSERDSDQVHLMDGTRQVGTFRYLSGNYYPFDGEKWASKPTAIPKGAGTPPKKAKGERPSLLMPVPEGC